MTIKKVWVNKSRFNIIPIFTKHKEENDFTIDYGFQLSFLWFTLFFQINNKNLNK